MEGVVKITETFVRRGDKTFMESSLQPGKWSEVPVIWLDALFPPKTNGNYHHERWLTRTEFERLYPSTDRTVGS